MHIQLFASELSGSTIQLCLSLQECSTSVCEFSSGRSLFYSGVGVMALQWWLQSSRAHFLLFKPKRDLCSQQAAIFPASCAVAISPVNSKLLRLDKWYLGPARAGSQPPAPVPFFLEVHEEVTRSCTAPFFCPKLVWYLLPPHCPRWYQGVRGDPSVEHAVAMQLCPKSTATWGGTRVSHPRPVSFRPFSRPRLTELLDRLSPPCMPWLSGKNTRPRQ